MSLGIPFPDPVSSTLRMVKIIFITLVVMVVCALGYSTHYFYQENKKVLEEKGKLSEQVTTLTHDLELVRVGTAAMNLGQLLADKQKDKVISASSQVRDKLKTTEISIDNSGMTAEEKVVAKSTARMDSIWAMYCQIQPTNAVCRTIITPEVHP